MINDRVKTLRKHFNLTQGQLADKLGITDSSVSRIEKGESALTEGNIKLLCSQFDVNEEWLRYGKGDMFNPVEDSLDYLVAKYGADLSPNMQAAVRALLLMPEEKRKVFDEFLEEFDRLRTGNRK